MASQRQFFERTARNGGVFSLLGEGDPVALALQRWNGSGVTAGATPTGSEKPLRDGVAYEVLGVRRKYSRPYVRVSYRRDWLEGPEVRFVRRDDGFWLTVVLEEDPERRVEVSLPFDVRVSSIELKYGPEDRDVLRFGENILQEPLPDADGGPAFRVEASVKVPDERRAVIVSALQTADRASWHVTLEFDWATQSSDGPRRPPGSLEEALPDLIRILSRRNRPSAVARRRPDRVRSVAGPAAAAGAPAAVAPAEPSRIAARDAVFLRAAALPASRTGDGAVAAPRSGREIAATPIDRRLLRRELSPEVVRSILDLDLGLGIDLGGRPRSVETITLRRQLPAFYPEGFPENDPIYAAITGKFAQSGWRSSAHGRFQPTHLLSTVYCLPDAYRIELDSATGLPAILPVLTLADDAAGGAGGAGGIDQEDLRVRLSFRVAPDFDAQRLDQLRDLIRSASSESVMWADLVLGGYTNPRFVADESLEGLGGVLAGTTAGDQDFIDAQGGFTLNYEGSTEFLALLTDRLQGAGISAKVELDLVGPTGDTEKVAIPVVLALRQTTPIDLDWEIRTPPLSEDGEQGAVTLLVTNPSSRAVGIAGIQATALLSTPQTRQVIAFQDVSPASVGEPIVLAGGETRAFDLTPDDEFLANSWDVSFHGVRLAETEDPPNVLRQLFDATTASVQGWRVVVDCPPLEFFDRLPEEERQRFSDVVAVEVELRRLGSEAVQDLVLNLERPRGQVLLSRTLFDFLPEGGGSGQVFEYRRRVIRITRPEPWSDWRQDRGSALTVFFE